MLRHRADKLVSIHSLSALFILLYVGQTCIKTLQTPPYIFCSIRFQEN